MRLATCSSWAQPWDVQVMAYSWHRCLSNNTMFKSDSVAMYMHNVMQSDGVLYTAGRLETGAAASSVLQGCETLPVRSYSDQSESALKAIGLSTSARVKPGNEASKMLPESHTDTISGNSLWTSTATGKTFFCNVYCNLPTTASTQCAVTCEPTSCLCPVSIQYGVTYEPTSSMRRFETSCKKMTSLEGVW